MSLSLVAGMLPMAGAPAPAMAVSEGIVISQVYGGGGNSGAPLTNDFVELFNRGSSAISITGWSVQYASATGTGNFSSNAVTVLSGSLAPGQHYLVQLAGGANGVALPTPDAVGTVNMSGASGKVIVANVSTGIACNGGSTPCTAAQLAQIVDLVGYGTANFFEGTAAAPLLTNETAGLRGGSGCAETDDNAADFAAATPDPRNTASPFSPCSGSTDPTGVGAANPGSVAPGDSTLLSVTVTPGADPSSTGLAVSGDLTAIGGSATQAFFDDGSNGDVTAADNVFSFMTTVAVSTSGGVKTLSATISDAQARSGLASISLTVDVPGTLVINEIDYDQPGTDATEFVEIKNVSESAIELDPYTLELVNGTGGTIYKTVDLPAVSLAAGAYFVVCGNAATVAGCDLDESPDTNLIQNGAPDAVGLRLGTALVDAVSYEGDTVAPYTEGSGAGLVDDGANAAASIGRCPDGADTGQNNVDFELHPATPGAANNCSAPPACGTSVTAIHDIQGMGNVTPLGGATVVIEGIVVGDYQQSGGFGGFFVQEQDSDADANPASSEGIFVFFPTGPDVAVGDAVTVCGTVTEFSGLTELTSVATTTVDSSGNPLPTASSLALPVASLDNLEPFEGMRVSFAQELTVTEVFTLARFGEVALSGSGRLANPTNVVEPGAPAIALQDLNDRSRILLDDGDNTQNRDPVRYPQGGLSASNTLRVGDTLDGLAGVLDYRFGVYRVQPVLEDLAAIEFDHANPRPAAPDSVGGNLKVASFNVLNYFNGDGLGGGFPTARGANTPAELARQTDKIVSALTGLDADIVGLMELENDSGPQQAIADLVDALNVASSPGTYAYLDTGVIGSDEIKVGLIYKPASVSPVGAFALLTTAVDPRFDDSLNRPALAQSFELAAGGRLTVVVNHLKSKGSACDAFGDPDTGDGQGNCNLTRTHAAEALVDWIATDPTASGDRDTLVIGDLNSYAKEDPIDVFVDAGFTDLHQAFEGADAYSYVFQGQSGYLDHALASPTLAAQVTGMTSWHINPDEPTALDYNVEFKSPGQVASFYDAGPYRSSDHDPVLVGIQLANRDAVGLLPPIGTATVKAGQTVPVQFSLGGFAGYDILYETPQVFACAGYPLGSSQDIVTAGRSMLSYDATADVYTIAWKTSKGWAGTCRTVEVTFDDGSYLFADVDFVK